MSRWFGSFGRWKWLDRLLVRVEAYTALAEQYPWIKWTIRSVAAAVLGLYTYIAESWAPLAAVTALFAFVALTLLPRALRADGSGERSAEEESYREWSYDAAEEAPDVNAYYDLMGFTLKYVLPACEKQIELQEQIIHRITNNYDMAVLAVDGLQQSDKFFVFWENYNKIIEGLSSSEYTIRFAQLIKCIRKLESGSYRKFCEHSNELAESNNIDLRSDETIGPIWEQWRDAHNKLITEYNDVKEQVRFGGLFKPLKESRWGNTVD